MYKILVTATNFSKLCKESKAFLLEHDCQIIENTYGRPMTFDERKDIVGDIDAAIIGPDVWDEKLFALAPRLQCLARFGVGVDNIDFNAATAHGVKVFNAAGMNSNSVAEHTVALMLSCVRQIPHLNVTTRQNAWERCICHEFNSMTVGLLGFGGIARLVAEKLQPFGCKVIAHDLYPNYEVADRLNVEIVSFEDAMRRSEIISVHLPCLPDTIHKINSETLGLAKDGVYFINTARGPIVDETALYRALVSGKVAAAGLDVYEHEPISPDNPLLSLENVICTPHAAAESYEVYRDVALFSAQEIIKVFQGQAPRNWMNKF